MEKRTSFGAWRAPVLSAAAALLLAGCGDSGKQATIEQQKQELTQLRTVNEEVRKLRAANEELEQLRKNNLELQKLKGQLAGAARLKQENNELRVKLGQASAGDVADSVPGPVAEQPEPPKTITNVPQAFEEAAFAIVGQVTDRPEDMPQEGDTIMLDQSVIETLIPGLTNGGPYEVSGWLKSKGVTIKNYQQLNYLGLTNYKVLRSGTAPTPELPPNQTEPPPNQNQ